MTLFNLFSANTNTNSPLDSSTGESGSQQVSGFITIQSFTNFGIMTGAIIGAWSALKLLNYDLFSSIIVPYIFSFLFGLMSVLISISGLKKLGQTDMGSIGSAIFIGIINSLVLASAVVGATSAVTKP